MTIPVGFCQCGCGARTNISKLNDARAFVKAGEPFRYLKGHAKRTTHSRVDTGGYRLVVAPGNGRASSRRVHEHVLVVEAALGHPLPPGTAVHHVNEQKQDNRPANLCVLQDNAEHMALHLRLRVLRAGGNPWTQRVCCLCKRPKDLDQFYTPKDRRASTSCKECDRARATKRQRQQREAGAA